MEVGVSGIKDVLSPFPELLFKPCDSYDLTIKIENLIKKKSKVQNSYRNHILRNYNIVKEVDNHEKVYKNLLKIG